MSTNTPNQPVDRVRFGAVQAALWRNQDSEGRVRYNFSLERVYKDPNGDWQSTGSFGRDDALVVGKVAERAFERIHELQVADREKAARAQTGQGASR